MIHHRSRIFTFCALFAALAPWCAAEPPEAVRLRGTEALVNITTIDPTIMVELRYATERNVTGRPIYPPNTPCLVRPSVAERLRYAQQLLQKRGYGLKIWDGHRPAWVQQILWEFVRNPEFVAEPAKGGSLHTWGLAVDVTLVDSRGREQKMPTDFDDFTAAAAMRYKGGNSRIAKNLRILQSAMASAGFHGMRDEWWHFMARDSRDDAPDTSRAERSLPAPAFVRR